MQAEEIMDDRTRKWFWCMMPILAPGFVLAMFVFGLPILVEYLIVRGKK